MGDLQDMHVRVDSIEAYQGISDLPMDVLPPYQARLVVEHMSNQRVGKPESIAIAQKYALV
jgi:hypothetical protein